jgi:hypothetical protein
MGFYHRQSPEKIMKITDVKTHHIEWERGPHHWRVEIMPSGARLWSKPAEQA